jgi:DNA-binding transcriptional LysR family regulator
MLRRGGRRRFIGRSRSPMGGFDSQRIQGDRASGAGVLTQASAPLNARGLPYARRTQLLGLAREAVSAASAFTRSAHTRHQRSAVGWVRVAAPVGFILEVLWPILADFVVKHPSIRLDLRASNELVDLAKDGVDIAVRSGALDRVPGHLQRPWFKFPWVACASPDYIAKRGTPKVPADLDAHTLIGFRNQRTGQVRPRWFRSPDPDRSMVQFAPDASTIFDDGASAWRAAAHGGRVGSAPLWLAADDLRA